MSIPTEEELRSLPEADVREQAVALAEELARLRRRDTLLLAVFGKFAVWIGLVATGPQLYDATRDAGRALHGFAKDRSRPFPMEALIDWVAALLHRWIRIGLFRLVAFVVGPLVLMAQLVILYQQNKILGHQLSVDERELAQAAITTSIATRTVLSRPPLDASNKPIVDYHQLSAGDAYPRIARWPRPNASHLQQLRAFLSANYQQGVSSLEPLLFDDDAGVASSVFVALATHPEPAVNADTPTLVIEPPVPTAPRAVNLLQADLGFAALTGMRWRGGRASKLHLEHASLTKARWHQFTAPDVRAEGLQADEARFVCADFTNGHFAESDFTRAVFVGVNLENACLANADLTETTLVRTRLTGADLTCATLSAGPSVAIQPWEAEAANECPHVVTEMTGANLYLVRAEPAWIAAAFSAGAICIDPDGTRFAPADCPVRSPTQIEDPCFHLELQCHAGMRRTQSMQ